MKNKKNTFAGFGKFSKRQAMVEEQLVGYGIRDRRVIDAFLTIPRHLFVPESEQDQVHRDGPVQIGYNQTLSQPYVVALMLEALRLRPTDRVLEIGSGSGYVCALLSLLVDRVTGIELQKELVTASIRVMNTLELKNVRIYQGNGYAGYAPQAPYDAIIVSAAPADVPMNLLKQLKPKGKMIIPVGEEAQELILMEKRDGKWVRRILTEVRFVPLREAPEKGKKKERADGEEKN